MAYEFKKYKLSKAQLEHVAGMCKQEQGSSIMAVKFEASLAANLYEERGGRYATINDYIRNSGWFASTSKNKTTSDKKLVQAVKEVLVEGKRVLPPQINEHDWTGDIKSLSTGGDKTKRSSYTQFKTVVHAIGTWTFYVWPKFTDDPFGTTKPEALKKWLKKYATKGQYFWGSDTFSDSTTVDAKVAYYGPTYETTETVTKQVAMKDYYNTNKGNTNSQVVTPETANKKVTVKEKVKKTVKRKYSWTGHGTPEGDLKKGTLVCAAPSNIPYGTKIKITGTGTKYDNKEFTVKDRLSDTKVKNGKYYIALLVKNWDKEKPSAWLNGKATFSIATSGNSDFPNEADSEQGTLQVHADKLYSSDNYAYIQANEVAKETAFTKLKTSLISSVLDKIKSLFDSSSNNSNTFSSYFTSNAISDVVINFKNINRIAKQKVEPKTIVKGATSTSVLPVVSVAVEAPYFEVEMGGIKIGGYHNNEVPNYVKSLTVKKINGSINEYSFVLIHQIKPGDNPNYIDNILSGTGYNYINIRYGNANTGQIFTDYKAMVTNVTQTFDFTNCNIIYNVSATSIAAATSAQRFNFSEFTGKASDRIRWLLYESMTDILSIFPGMSNRTKVEQQGLIPTNDDVITMGPETDITSVEYLRKLANRMTFTAGGAAQNVVSSIYMLNVSDDTSLFSDSSAKRKNVTDTYGATFKITEIKPNLSSVPFMYEVNVGYPDNNFVLDFSVRDNFAWSIAYESSKKIVKYDYEIDSLGNLTKQNIPACYEKEEDELGYRNLWTSLTRFPIKATLTIRGLLEDSLLMQYIKINCIMYGAKRITSGVYIVTEQEDSIGNGVYTTKLSLMRISGDNEYVNIDGRKIT